MECLSSMYCWLPCGGEACRNRIVSGYRRRPLKEQSGQIVSPCIDQRNMGTLALTYKDRRLRHRVSICDVHRVAAVFCCGVADIGRQCGSVRASPEGG